MIQTANIESTIYEVNGVSFEMITVEKGSFRMGDDKSEYDDEKPAHTVTFKTDFTLGKYPVTQALWKAVMGKNNNPSHFKGENCPVEHVSWEDIMTGNEKKGKVAFFKQLNAIPSIQQQNEKEGKQFRLPNEAQWEYAARGGKYWRDFNYKYAGSNQLKEVAWYWGNSHRESKPVGLKMPNILGFYDMNGNVWEWCVDDWHDHYQDAPEDGTSWLKSKKENIRVVRGGSWDSYNNFCRVALRFSYLSYSRNYFTGFRLSRY